MASLLIHRHQATDMGTPVNAYLVESAGGVVAIDATLTVDGGRGLRAQLDALGKPLAGVVLTHAHPDHYGGLVELVDGLDVPIVSTQLVHDVVRRDDPVKEQILRPMFGDAWPWERRFPERVVADGETVEFGDIALTVKDLGPSESPADSIWWLEGEPGKVFCADLVYNRKHAYLADGFHDEWLRNIAWARDALPAGATLHPGHGDPVGLEAVDFQRRYIETLVGAVRSADWSAPEEAKRSIVATMRELLPTDDLQFLMELSLEPLARHAGVLS